MAAGSLASTASAAMAWAIAEPPGKAEPPSASRPSSSVPTAPASSGASAKSPASSAGAGGWPCGWGRPRSGWVSGEAEGETRSIAIYLARSRAAKKRVKKSQPDRRLAPWVLLCRQIRRMLRLLQQGNNQRRDAIALFQHRGASLQQHLVRRHVRAFSREVRVLQTAGGGLGVGADVLQVIVHVVQAVFVGAEGRTHGRDGVDRVGQFLDLSVGGAAGQFGACRAGQSRDSGRFRCITAVVVGAGGRSE